MRVSVCVWYVYSWVFVCSRLFGSFHPCFFLLTRISLLIQLVNKGEDSQAEEEESRPPIDLFKAIFASSSEEKSSSSEDEQGDSEDEQEGPGEADVKSSQEANLVETSAAHSTSVFQTLGCKWRCP